jgi:rhodanese-related sulfurtransferase
MTYQSLLVTEVAELCAQAQPRILDCRDPRSFEQGHLPGAQLVSDEVIKRLARSDKDQPVLVYCYHGISSRDLATFLVNFGFSAVFNLEGGWQAWADQLNRRAATTALSEQLQSWLRDQGFEIENINSRIRNGMTPLMRAALLAETTFVQELLQAGADINLLNDDMNNALWFACVSESAEIIQLLLEYGINLNNSNVNGATSLIYASSAGKYMVVEALVKAGADLAAQTLDGFTALDSAATVEVLRFLKRQSVAA